MSGGCLVALSAYILLILIYKNNYLLSINGLNC